MQLLNKIRDVIIFGLKGFLTEISKFSKFCLSLKE